MADLIQELEVSNDQSIPLGVAIKDVTGTEAVDVVNTGNKYRLCVDTNIGGIGKDTQTSAFGLLKIANESTLADYRFDVVSTPDKFIVTTVNAGSYSIEPGATGIKLSTGAAINSKIQLDSKLTHYYQSGRGQMAKFSIVLGDTGIVGNIREWGYGNNNNGFFIRLDGITLNLVIKYNGSETIIPSNTWDIPTAISPNGHLWYFQFQWLGVGNLYLWYDEKIVHTYKFLGTSINLSTGTPDLPVRLKNENTTNNTNIYMKCGCISVVTEGGNLLEGQDQNGQIRRISTNELGHLNINVASGSNVMRAQHNDILPSLANLDYSNLQLDSRGRLITTQQDTTKKSIQIGYEKSPTEVLVDYSFKELIQYEVPAGWRLELTSIASIFGDARMAARYSKHVELGSFNIGTNTYTAYPSHNYVLPLFAASLEAEVTTTMGNINDVILTATYTNQDNVSGRTAVAFKIKKNSAIKTKYLFSLQGGDFGILSVQNVTYDKVNTGVVTINGVIGITRMQNNTKALTSVLLTPARESIIILAGEFFTIDCSTSGNVNHYFFSKAYGLLTEV